MIYNLNPDWRICKCKIENFLTGKSTVEFSFLFRFLPPKQIERRRKFPAQAKNLGINFCRVFSCKEFFLLHFYDCNMKILLLIFPQRNSPIRFFIRGWRFFLQEGLLTVGKLTESTRRFFGGYPLNFQQII